VIGEGEAMNIRHVLATILMGLCCAMSSGVQAENSPIRQVVLHPGQSVEAANKFGRVKVSYVSPVKRKYEWDGKSRIVKMIPRPEPWLGELGLYDPADCYFMLCRMPRLVVEEAYHDFDSYDQIYAFLWQGSAVMDWVYTSDGLLVGFGRSPDRGQINVDVRQITLRGKKPSGLRGARNGAIHLTSR
jgi:hypothetical protein